MAEGKNPVLMLDYPDMDIIRVDDTYYGISTTMHYMPGGVILRSYDLIHWEHAAYIYDILEDDGIHNMDGDGNFYGKGMWAATLRHHNGKFYAVFVANETHKTYLFVSDTIEGHWERKEIKGFYHDVTPKS